MSEEKVSLYDAEDALTTEDVLAVQPGDLVRVDRLGSTRVELPSGMRINPNEDTSLKAELSDLPPAERYRRLREKRKETRKKKQEAQKELPPKTRRIRGSKLKITGRERIRSSNHMWSRAAEIGKRIAVVEQDDGCEQHVFSCGTIHIGSDLFVVGVIPGRKLIYLGRGGAVLLLSAPEKYNGSNNPHLKEAALNPSKMLPGERALWADAICRQVVDLYTKKGIKNGLESMAARYRMLVNAHIDGAIVDMAANGITRTRDEIMKACDRTWTEDDLLPMAPSIKHAVIVSLALRLEPDDAVMLIEYAAFLELQLGLLQREAVLVMYMEAKRQLSELCPTWHLRGKVTDWKAMDTSVHELMKLQFARACNDAYVRGLPLEAASGLRVTMTQLGEAPFAGSYINRTFKPEIGLEALNKLRAVPVTNDAT